MRTLQRYILVELVRVLALIITITSLLLVFVGVFQEATQRGLGPLQALAIMPYVVPSMLPFTIPATLLLAVCIVYGRLSADYEITAAKAAGVNVTSLLFPSFFLGGLLTVCSLLLNDQIIPWSVGNIQRIVTMAMEDIFFDLLASQNVIEYRNQGFSVSVAGVDRANNRLIQPVVRFSPGGKDEAIVTQATVATVRFDYERQQIILEPEEAWVDAPNQFVVLLRDKELPLPLPFGNDKIKSRHLTISTLEEQMGELSRSALEAGEQQVVEAAFLLALGEFEQLNQPRFQQYSSRMEADQSLQRKHHTELHNRFALSCSCFFFALLGGPFSMLQARRQFLTTFFLCFMPILLIYYPVILLMMNLSKTGAVDPGWAMWAGNAMLLLCSVFVLRKAVQH